MKDYAIEEPTAVDEAQDQLYLTFLLGGEVYGIGIDYVREIIGIQPVTPIPEYPVYIRGVINLRGKIIPVMDVRLRFGKPEQPYDARTCIIVVDIFDALVGLIVDRVSEVVAIPDDKIAEPPKINGREAGFLKGLGMVGGSIKLLLDCNVLLADDAKIIQQTEGE